jgi:hypothetical protein
MKTELQKIVIVKCIDKKCFCKLLWTLKKIQLILMKYFLFINVNLTKLENAY